MDDANRLSDANRRLIGQHAPMIDTEWETIPLLQVELDVLLNTARSEGRKAADTALSERVAELEKGLEEIAREGENGLDMWGCRFAARALLHPSEGEAGT
jgi:hypothetical protein